MEILLYFILLLNVYCCFSNSEDADNYWRHIVHDNEYYGHQNHDRIQRPCSLHDVNCIRRYFAYNSQCLPVHGPAPDPYRMKTLLVPLPHANITFTMNDIQVKGLNDWKIKEFYINKETDRLVLEVEFHSLVVYTSVAVITYHRKGKEPLELSDDLIIDYRSLSFTMTVPNIRNIQLSNAHVYTYISDAAPKYRLGSAITESKDPFIKAVNSRMLDDIGVSIQEGFVVKGPVFMSVFVQSTICDFKLR